MSEAQVGKIAAISEMATLYVDLDGTLIATDLLHESFVRTLRRSPFSAFQCVFWLASGRPVLKSELAARAMIDVGNLPYREEVVAFLREEKARGRRIVLATATCRQLADDVAAHLGVFSDVLATERGSNLKGATKRAAIAAHSGGLPYDYLGDSPADLVVWEGARSAYVVDRSGRLASRVESRSKVERVFPASSSGVFRSMIRAIRVHQWAKNLLLFVPLVTSHEIFKFPALRGAALGFVAFCLVASSAYILNDLLDLDADRAHPRKRNRPFASGALSIPAGVGLFVALLALGSVVAMHVPFEFQAALLAYFLVTMAYSLVLKRLAVVDVIVLASLYTVRIIGGTFAIAAPLSFWLLGFAMFIFFSLALLKRYSELHSLRAAGGGDVPGRGYATGDAAIVLGLGTSSAMMSALVFALYINGETAGILYSRPQVLWLLCPLLLYWLSRIWMLASRGLVHDDPVLFTVRDTVSYGIVAVGSLVIWAAT